MASTKLSRAMSSQGSSIKSTFSCWFKLADGSGHTGGFYSTAYSASYFFDICMQSGSIEVGDYRSNLGGYQCRKRTTAVYRDVNAWYHLYVAIDRSLSTASDRCKIYVNGERVTNLQSSEDANYSQQTSGSHDSQIMMNNGGSNTYAVIGNRYDNSKFNGSISHMYWVDGSVIDIAQFGSTDSTTGEWKINTSPTIASYGTNGFLILKDGNTITDQSGGSYDFTVASGTLTKSEDNPSNVFATGNPLIGIHSNGNGLVPTYTNGNTTSTSGGSAWKIHQSNLGASSGKYYAEFKLISNSGTWYSYVGIYDLDGYAQKISGYPYLSDMANTYGLKDGNGQIHTGGSGTSYGVSYGTGNIVGVAMDLDNNKLYFSKDGVWMNSANPSNGTGGYSITADKTYAFGIQQYAQNSIVWSANYGNGFIGTTAVSSAGTNASNNGIFEYDVPTGFTALSTKGLNL